MARHEYFYHQKKIIFESKRKFTCVFAMFQDSLSLTDLFDEVNHQLN